MLFSLLSLSAFAAEPVNPFREADESALYRFDEQLVTVASRYAQTVRKAPSIVSLVTSEDIRAGGFRTVSDVLRTIPGIYLWKSVEGRDLAGVRGVISADNNKLLVMIDGVPWYDGVYTHGFIDDYLPIHHIRQIEVIKGPGSAIYGTNAFSGVVNIVTFGAEELDGGRARWMVGSTGRSDATATVGGVLEAGGVDTSVSAYARSLGQWGDGLDLTPRGRHDVLGRDPKQGFAAGVNLAHGGLKIQAHHVDYQHTYLVGEADDPLELAGLDLDTTGLAYHGTFLNGRFDWDVSRDLRISPNAWFQRHDNPGSYFFSGGLSTVETEPGVFETTESMTLVETEKDSSRWGAGIDMQARPGIDHVLVAGLGVENVNVLSLYDAAYSDGDRVGDVSGFFAPDSCGQPTGWTGNRQDCRHPALTNLFGYAQYSWTVAPSLELTGGARVDKRVPRNEGEVGSDKAFVTSVSPRVGVLLVPSDAVTGKLLYGRAFRAPNVRELLVTAPKLEDGNYAFTSGNVNLLPESIHTVEGQLQVNPAERFEASVGGYYSALVNEIDKVSPPYLYCNIPGGLSVVGAEAAAKGGAGPLDVNAAYALTLANYGDASDIDPALCPDVAWRGSPYGGRSQYEFPPHMIKGGASVKLHEQVSASVLTEWYSSRTRRSWSPDAKNADGKAFALVHVAADAARFGPDERFGMTLSVRNLLDSAWGTGVYRDDANALSGDASRYPLEFEGEGRSVNVALEVQL